MTGGHASERRGLIRAFLDVTIRPEGDHLKADIGDAASFLDFDYRVTSQPGVTDAIRYRCLTGGHVIKPADTANLALTVAEPGMFPFEA
jgi:hypothetical protein